MTVEYTLKLDDVLDGGPTEAEQEVIDACRLGHAARFGSTRPDTPTKENTIRAALIRHLLLGGCDAARPHPKGVNVVGAWVEGALDFQSCHTRLYLSLHRSHCTGGFDFDDAEIAALFLTGSKLPGLSLERARIETNVHLRECFECTSTAILRSAQIGGQLSCTKGVFSGGLNGQGLNVREGVFLSNGFEAQDVVNLHGAQIGGQLSCTKGVFSGGLNGQRLNVREGVFLSDGFEAQDVVNLHGAQIGGQLDCVNGTFSRGLDLESATIKLGLFWRDVKGDVPMLDLCETKAAVLSDDAASWQAVDTLRLSGFRYDALHSNMGVQDRLNWLDEKAERWMPDDQLAGLLTQPWLRPDFKRFDPQPYTQLAKVYDAQGDRAGAARILQRREGRIRKAMRERDLARVDGDAKFERIPQFLSYQVKGAIDFIFGRVFGYGHQPVYALGWVALIWLFGVLLYGTAYATGQMAPNSDVILTSANWLASVEQYDSCTADCIKPMTYWLENKPEATDYETFSRGLYALDLFVPLDALGQESTWAPSKDRGMWGWLGYYARMPIQLSGWIITAVGAAVLTGLVGRKD